jgi:NAD(P)-dependent dehydrogenase (short-subunit alcohol dehydrogenase family)
LTTGTGAAIARAFASQGYSVALLARTESHINSLADEIKSAGGTAHAFPTDLQSPTQLAETFSSIKSLGLPLKVAIFNLNTRWTVKPFLELKQEEYQGVISGHLGAAFSFAQGALKEMVPAGDAKYDGTVNGTLIFTGATAATRGSAKFAALASASFGLRALRFVNLTLRVMH